MTQNHAEVRKTSPVTPGDGVLTYVSQSLFVVLQAVVLLEADSVHSETQAIWNGVRTVGKKVHARARTRFRQSHTKEGTGVGGGGRKNQIVTLAS